MASLVLDSFILHRQVNESTSPLDVERLATKPRLIRACLALRTETKAHSPAPLNAFMLFDAASLWSRGCAIYPSIHLFNPLSIYSSVRPSFLLASLVHPGSRPAPPPPPPLAPQLVLLLLMARCQHSQGFTRTGTRALSSLPDLLLSCYTLQSREDECRHDRAHTLRAGGHYPWKRGL